MAFEAGERAGGGGAGEPAAAAGLRALADSLDPAMLDALEEMGYEEWVLRLSPHVRGDDPVARALRWKDTDDAHVRYWAGVILQSPPGSRGGA